MPIPNSRLPKAAKDLPPQPGDDKPVNPANPDGPTWGQLFGRQPEKKAKRIRCVACEGTGRNRNNQPCHPCAGTGVQSAAREVPGLPKGNK